MIIEREKRSVIWLIDEIKFRELVAKHKTYTNILNELGLESKGGNTATLKRRIQKLNISTDHFDSYYKNKEITNNLKTNHDDAFCENSTYSRKNLRKRIIKEKIIPYKCNKCGNDGKWCNEKLSLQLEHKNGTGNDNRIENLEFLCPNCHSQTESFAGKKNKKY